VGGSTFAGGAGTAGAAGAGAAGAAGTGAAAGGAGASGAAGTAASSGPWGWLAAAIIANETFQAGEGNRNRSQDKQIEHALTGKVFEDDAEVWGQMIDKDNKIGVKGDIQVLADIGSGDFSNALKGLEDTTGVKAIKGLF
jgi:hypothetical protein